MEREDLLDERMKALNAEAEEDFHLDDYSLKETTLKAPNIKIKWTRILSEEQKLLKLLETKAADYKRGLLETKFDINLAQYQKELEIDKDTGILKFKVAIDNQKDIIRFVEGIVRIAQGFGFDIKNVVDIIRLEQ
jgi:hypothetical protein